MVPFQLRIQVRAVGRIISPSNEGGMRATFTFDDGTGSMQGGMWSDRFYLTQKKKSTYTEWRDLE